MPNFDIQSGDEILIKGVVQNYNQKFKTDFKIIKFEEDDFVLFATIEYERAELSDIFELGGYFEAKVREMRQSKKIDW